MTAARLQIVSTATFARKLSAKKGVETKNLGLSF
jgi:hypothetical protein